jgi:hypothetical protein
MINSKKGEKTMKKALHSISFTFVFLMVITSACIPATNTPLTPTPTPTPTLTLITPTLLPTDTPLPTKTSMPTKTPIPPTPTIQAPDKTLEYLNGVHVVNIDTFDSVTDKWGNGLISGGISNGVLKVIGKDWNGIVRNREFHENEGIVIDFTYAKGSVFEMYFGHGNWNTDGYKRFGIYMDNNYARVNVWAGKNGLGGARLPGNFLPKPDTNYSLLMALLPNGEFLAVIWDLSDPSKTILYREKIGKNWSNLNWVFAIGADKGTILFDNFREIAFDSVK